MSGGSNAAPPAPGGAGSSNASGGPRLTGGADLHDGAYQDMWVFCEQRDGAFVPVALEMIGEARRLMDTYNQEYRAKERVVAVVVGAGVDALAKEAIARGADVAVEIDHPELASFRLEAYTRVVADAARAKVVGSYQKPRYFLFPATPNGRDLSATVLAELDSGLASDCNKLYIEDVEIKHPFKTGGSAGKIFTRILHMKRPDFSGFEWSTILCIDNPDKPWQPQSCSVIPGSFKPLSRDGSRKGELYKISPTLGARELRVKVKSRRPIVKEADLTGKDVIVALGRGIGKDPSKGLAVGVDLARVMNAGVGISRGIVTAGYAVDASVAQFTKEVRQIGETGQTVKPKVYVALGISGAIQHKKGMDQSAFIVAVNTEDDVPIKEFCDVFVKGDLFEVAPKLAAELGKGAKK